MERRIFLKRVALFSLGGLLCPKEIFSTPERKTNNDINKSTDIEIPKDLIKFAKQFSEKYKKLSCGTYVSDCGKYRIDYVHRRRTDNKSPYGVNRRTGIMEFSKSKLVNTPPSYVFNGIIWCYFIEKTPNDYVMADTKSIRCSLENGYSKKEIFNQNCKTFKDSPSELNRKRISELYKYIMDFKNI